MKPGVIAAKLHHTPRKDRPLYSWISHLNDLDSLLCWIPSVYGPHWGHTLVRHQPVDTLQDTLFGMCHRLVKEPTRVCACMFDRTQHVDSVASCVRYFVPPRAGDCLPVHRPQSWSRVLACCRCSLTETPKRTTRSTI